ncbi:hypothetical protein HGM15179_003372, partial [Zosterops borbonicus]
NDEEANPKKIPRCMKDNKFTESSWCRLIKEKSCSIKLVDFFDENTGPVDDEKEFVVTLLYTTTTQDSNLIRLKMTPLFLNVSGFLYYSTQTNSIAETKTNLVNHIGQTRGDI